MSRPHIILITTDQQRYDSIRAHGSAFMTTPNLDRIIREGVSFQRAYCPNTVCTPSRVSMMTGMHLSRHGSYNIGTAMQDDSLFMSRLLRNHGYTTRHVGKAHWFPWEADSPETQSPDCGLPFADFAGFHTAELAVGHGPWGVTSHYGEWVRSNGRDPSDVQVEFLFKGQGDPNGTGQSALPKRLHQGAWVAERAVHWLRETVADEEGRPLFLNLGFQDPHHPHVLPFDFDNRIDPLAIPLPNTDTSGETGTPLHIPLFREGTLTQSRFNGRFDIAGNGPYAWERYFQREDFARMTRAYYYSLVQLVDEQIGIILNALDELGLADNTLLIFTSDHGEMLGDHAIGQKGPLIYEGVTHIPLLMRYPDRFQPRTSPDECVSLVDLLPTIADWAGITDPVRREGISLRPCLERGDSIVRKGVRIEFKEEPDRLRYKGWVTPEWKLALYLGESFGELYDLRNDPEERHNLFGNSDYREIVNQLMMEMIEDMERGEPVNPRLSRA